MPHLNLSLDYLPKLPRNKSAPIGCIGSGFIMADCHLVAYRKAGFNPVAIASRTPEHAREVAQRHGMKAYDTYEAMLASGKVEVVDIAFPSLSFTRPVDITHAGDGSNRLFVVEQDGVIRVLANDWQTKEAKVFLDLKDAVRREHNEEGLLGLAFHPKYRENGEFFVFYSVTPRGSRVSRFKVSQEDPHKANRSSEEKLLEYPKPYGNHNGGCLKFGPDGKAIGELF